MLLLYQAERTRAEEQLQQFTAETRAQLQQKDDQLQQKDDQLGHARTQLQQKNVELNSVQQNLQV